MLLDSILLLLSLLSIVEDVLIASGFGIFDFKETLMISLYLVELPPMLCLSSFEEPAMTCCVD